MTNGIGFSSERNGVPAGLVSAGDAGDGLGAELFALVAKARAAGLDPELELRGAARRYQDRVHAWEAAQQVSDAARQVSDAE